MKPLIVSLSELKLMYWSFDGVAVLDVPDRALDRTKPVSKKLFLSYTHFPL